jgi:hypothetical protein
MIKSTERTRPVDAVARRDTLAGFILQKSRQSPERPSRKRIKEDQEAIQGIR